MNKAQETAPDVIYLLLGDVGGIDFQSHLRDFEVFWCEEPAETHHVKYIKESALSPAILTLVELVKRGISGEDVLDLQSKSDSWLEIVAVQIISEMERRK